MLSSFIQNNSFWLAPIVSIILTVVIKIASKPESITLGIIDYWDFGYDLSISSVVVLLTGAKGGAELWLLVLAFLLIIITIAVTHRVGWDKTRNQQNLFGVLFPDFVGIFLLIITTLYVGGVIA